MNEGDVRHEKRRERNGLVAPRCEIFSRAFSGHRSDSDFPGEALSALRLSTASHGATRAGLRHGESRGREAPWAEYSAILWVGEIHFAPF